MSVNEDPSQLDVPDSKETPRHLNFEQIIINENEVSASSVEDSADPTDDPLENSSNIREHLKKELEKELARRYRERNQEKVKENISSTLHYEARKERDKKYRERHRDEINSRRRENRQRKKNGQRSTNEVPIDIEDREKRKKELHRERQRRYYERHREEINRRQKDYRALVTIAQQDASGGASVIDDISREIRKNERLKERQRRYREKNLDKINQRQKKYRQLVSYVQKSANIQALDMPKNNKIEQGRKTFEKDVIDDAVEVIEIGV